MEEQAEVTHLHLSQEHFLEEGKQDTGGELKS